MIGKSIKINMSQVIEAVTAAVQKDLFEKHYPIGHIYLTTSDKNPSELLGNGTWERIAKGRALVGVDPDSNDKKINTVCSTFGEAEVALTVEQMPAHSHKVFSGWQGVSEVTSQTIDSIYYRQQTNHKYNDMAKGNNPFIQNTGGGAAHENCQPSFTCNIWRRLA